MAVISAGSQEAREIYNPYPRQIARPLWSADGRLIYFLSSVWSDRNLVAGDLFVVSTERSEGKPTDLTHGYNGSVTWMEFLSPDRLLLTSIEDTKTVFSTLSGGDGGPGMRKIWEGDIALSPTYWQSFSLAPRQGLLAVAREDLENPTEAWTGRIAQDSAGIVGETI